MDGGPGNLIHVVPIVFKGVEWLGLLKGSEHGETGDKEETCSRKAKEKKGTLKLCIKICVYLSMN